LGEAREGATLTCQAGTWGGSPEPVLTYQWLRGGTPIGAATAAIYRVSEADATSALMCRVTALNSAGSARADSKAVAIPGSPPAFTYQWLVEGVQIPAATGNTYTVTAASSGLTLSCEVTASNREGSSSAVSPGVHVPGVKPENIQTPQLSGTPSVGLALKCGPGVWAGKPPPVFSYEWFRDGAAIPAATAATYTVELADQGHTLS